MSSKPAYGPRVVSGPDVPKGGGGYKLGKPYRIGNTWYVPREEPDYDRIGVASWYGADFHGRRTANGELYDMAALTAAHPTLPLPSYVTVTNLANNRTILVRVNDRGPYANGRVIDLSRAAARALGYEGQGTAQVRVRFAGRAPLNGDDSRERQFLASAGQPGWQAGNAYAAPAPYAQANPPPPRPAPYPAAVPGPGYQPGYGVDSQPAQGWSPDAYRRGQTASAAPPAPKPKESGWSSGWGLGGF